MHLQDFNLRRLMSTQFPGNATVPLVVRVVCRMCLSLCSVFSVLVTGNLVNQKSSSGSQKLAALCCPRS